MLVTLYAKKNAWNKRKRCLKGRVSSTAMDAPDFNRVWNGWGYYFKIDAANLYSWKLEVEDYY
jgi:hypothetical protein